MSKEKKIIIAITSILLVGSLWLLFVLISGSMDKPYTSSITQVVTVSEWNQQDKLYFYWSNEKTVDETKFVEFEESPLNGKFILRYAQENVAPETIYLHVKKIEDGIATLERLKTNDYLNIKSNIVTDIPGVLTLEEPEMTIEVRTNGYTRLRAVHIQLSDNVLGATTAKELLQYRLLKSFSETTSNRRDIRMNLDDHNVGDGRYYLKITAIDTSGKVTVQYSEAFVVDFGLIRRAISFDTPIIGPDGQLVPLNSMQVTGDLLMRFKLNPVLAEEGTLESENKLTFYGNPLDATKLTTRRYDGQELDGIQYLATEQENVFTIKVDWNLPNDWYYVYHDDTLVGMFLCQISRG